MIYLDDIFSDLKKKLTQACSPEDAIDKVHGIQREYERLLGRKVRLPPSPHMAIDPGFQYPKIDSSMFDLSDMHARIMKTMQGIGEEKITVKAPPIHDNGLVPEKREYLFENGDSLKIWAIEDGKVLIKSDNDKYSQKKELTVKEFSQLKVREKGEPLPSTVVVDGVMGWEKYRDEYCLDTP